MACKDVKCVLGLRHRQKASKAGPFRRMAIFLQQSIVELIRDKILRRAAPPNQSARGPHNHETCDARKGGACRARTDDELRRLTWRRLQDRAADPLEHYEMIAELRALGAEIAVGAEQLKLSLPVAG
jgi:hypothetical protein